MALCSVEDVRAHANPTHISDLEILNIISVVSTEILTIAGSTDETNPLLIQAVIHAAAATVLKRARAIGELASSLDTPESKITFTGIIEEIKQHERDRDRFLALYEMPLSHSFSSYSSTFGFNDTGGN